MGFKASSKQLAEAAAEENKALEDAIIERITVSRLTHVGGKELNALTVRSIRAHLQRLPEKKQVKEVLEILEHRCRYLAEHPAEAQAKPGWEWLTGLVRGEVNKRLEKRQAALWTRQRRASRPSRRARQRPRRHGRASLSWRGTFAPPPRGWEASDEGPFSDSRLCERGPGVLRQTLRSEEPAVC